MADYIPTADGDLLNYATNFQNQMDGTEAALGLLPADTNALTLKVSAFQSDLTEHSAAQNSARSKRETKDLTRAALVSALRTLAKRVQAFPTVTDAQRATLGLTIADSIPSSVPVPTTRPVLVIDPSQRLKHVINFSDESTPTVRAKPYGAFGCEIFMSVGATPPAAESDWTYLATDTATPYEKTFTDADGGKKVYYQARWVNRSGDKGVWSAVVSSTIVA